MAAELILHHYTFSQTPRWRPPAAGDSADQPLTGTRRARFSGPVLGRAPLGAMRPRWWRWEMACPYCRRPQQPNVLSPRLRGYRRFRCHACARSFNERTGSIFNRAQYPPDAVCLNRTTQHWYTCSPTVGNSSVRFEHSAAQS